MKNRMMKNYMK